LNKKKTTLNIFFLGHIHDLEVGWIMGHSLNYMGSFVEGAAFSWELSDDLLCLNAILLTHKLLQSVAQKTILTPSLELKIG